MKIVSAGITSLAVALAMPAYAQLLAHKDLSLATALTIATTAADTCKGQGYRVSVSVVGRTGEAIVQLRGDDASPHTLDFSRRKAFTARTFRLASGEFSRRRWVRRQHSGCEPRYPLHTDLESGQGGPGHRQGLSDRPNQRGECLLSHCL